MQIGPFVFLTWETYNTLIQNAYVSGYNHGAVENGLQIWHSLGRKWKERVKHEYPTSPGPTTG